MTAPTPSPAERLATVGGLTRDLWERWFRQAQYITKGGIVEPGVLSSMLDDHSIMDLVAAAFDSRALLVEAQEVLRDAAFKAHRFGRTHYMEFPDCVRASCTRARALLTRLDAEIGERPLNSSGEGEK